MAVPSDLLTQLGAAILEERDSRKAAQEARSRQDQLLQQLRAERVPYTAIARHIAKAEGLTPSVQERKRIAQQLRQRVTRRHSSFGATDSHETASDLPWVRKEKHMPKLIKRVTEEYLAQDGESLDGIDETGDDELEEVDEEEEEEEEERSRSRRK